MNSDERRDAILEIISQSVTPVSASSLAKRLSISRQAIVGDVALLRAQGHEIIATARGYMVPAFRDSNQYIGKIVCCHNPEDTVAELFIMVDLSAIVINVVVEHDLYGEITGQLNLRSREDVNAFIRRVKSSEVKLLSELTMGIHLHTITCRDKTHFEQVCEALDKAGYLYRG